MKFIWSLAGEENWSVHVTIIITGASSALFGPRTVFRELSMDELLFHLAHTITFPFGFGGPVTFQVALSSVQNFNLSPSLVHDQMPPLHSHHVFYHIKYLEMTSELLWDMIKT